MSNDEAHPLPLRMAARSAVLPGIFPGAAVQPLGSARRPLFQCFADAGDPKVQSRGE